MYLTLILLLEGTLAKVSAGGGLKKKLFDFAYN